MKSTFWTDRRFAGMALILGCLAFLTAAGLTPRNAQGTYVYTLPTLREQLLLIFEQQQLWQWGMMLFMGGTVVTFLGFFLFTRVLREAGAQVFSQLGLLASLIGVLLLLIFLAFDGSVQPWAGEQIAKTGVLPDFYTPFYLWATALFHVYTFFAFSALALYGAAVLTSRVLPRWIGWAAIIYALAGLGFLAYAHDIPPFLHHLMPIVIGILLLLPQTQLSRGSRREDEPIVDSMTAVS